MYAEEDESYDYEPPPVPEGTDFDPNQFDPKIKQPRSMMKTAVFGAVALIFVIGALFVGMQIAEVGHDRNSVNRRINLAKDLASKVQPKLDAFVAFIKPFKDRVESGGRMESVTGYDQALFEQLGRYGSVDFMLDPSTDVPAEAIILAQNQKANPLPELRQYSSGTMILVQLISNHVSETNADKKEIAELLEATGSVEDETSELFALKFDPERYLEFIKEPLRVDGQFNFGVRAKGLWRVKKIVQSPEELAAIWKDMKGDYAAPAEEEDKTKGKKPKEKTEELGLPPKVIYQLQPRQGAPFYVLADEIILITRSEIFGATPNALQRYEKRMTQILKAIVETEKSVEPLGSKLKTQASEELL
ncbi:MAG: hypothetical protein COW42_06000 [Deltaproteobacteria bacterium CG17_big_fil_post_rev_8_21_14_2_50_63_7]|nr:MAG: hypothetical protein COW42_06000 [Deltaproteobacteria bacterium CG17_big_fil_post_rev_8_21_14_2_50_63_7]